MRHDFVNEHQGRRLQPRITKARCAPEPSVSAQSRLKPVDFLPHVTPSSAGLTLYAH